MAAPITADTAFAIDYFKRAEDRLEDLTPLMDAIGMLMETVIGNRFEALADPSGAAWAPWSANTRLSYPDDANGRLLDRYGDLLRSLTHQVGDNSTTVGFGQPHAVYHEFGTKHMPRRGLLFDDPEAGTLGTADQQSILDLVDDYLAQI